MTPPHLSRRDRLLAFSISWLAWALVQFIGRTSRLTVQSAPKFQYRFQQGLPVIYAFWHRYQLLMLFEKRNSGASVLVSRSRDGELVAQALHRLGFKTVRGSSSRGGGTAFMQLIDVVRGGGSVAFTPDGPRGPLHSIQPGVLALAAKMEIPVIPLAWAGSRTKELKSWDRFLIPKPFGRYAVVFGDPVYFRESGPAAEEKLRHLLNDAEREADRLLQEQNSPC